MRSVAGFDASLTSTGAAYSIAGRLYTSAYGGDAKMVRRLRWIFERTSSVLDVAYPDLVVIEDVPTHGLGSGLTATAWTAVALACEVRYVPYGRLAPATLKKFATGNGWATKDEMRSALIDRTGWAPDTDDEVDAMWLRYAGLSWLGLEDGFAAPEALTKGRWPIPRGRE